MKNDKYFKHDATASDNCKLTHLIECEGIKGYGIYWIILETIRKQSDLRVSLSSLKFVCRKFSIRLSTLQKILLNYDLFEEENGFFYSKGLCNRMQRQHPAEVKSTVGMMKPAAESTAKPTAEMMKPAVESTAKPSTNCVETSTKPSGNDAETTVINVKDPCNSLNVNESRFLYKDKDKEKNKERKNISKKERLSADDDDGDFCMQLVDRMAERDRSMEEAMTSAGLGEQYRKYKPQLIDFFKRHIRMYGKTGMLRHLSDVQRYFANFVSPRSTTTHQRLKEFFQQLEAAAYELDVFRFETRTNGRRTYYGGMPIPDYAPPRPTAHATWYEMKKQWI